MKTWWIMAVAAVALAGATAGQAYVNLTGATGLLATPNAHTVGTNNAELAADVIFFNHTVGVARGLYGITDRIEAGAILSLGDETGLGLAAKYQLPFQALSSTWGVGGSFFTSTGGVGDTSQLYLVATHVFPVAGTTGVTLAGSGGLNVTWRDGDSGLRPFVNAQLQLGPTNQVYAEAQFDSGAFAERSLLTLGARHTFTPTLSGQAGITNGSAFFGGRDYNLFVGAQLGFNAH